MFMVANFQSDDTLNIRLRTQTEDNTSDFSASGLNAGRKLERWRLCITRLRKDGIYVCLRRCCGILSSGLHSFKSKTFPKKESRKKRVLNQDLRLKNHQFLDCFFLSIIQKSSQEKLRFISCVSNHACLIINII